MILRLYFILLETILFDSVLSPEFWEYKLDCVKKTSMDLKFVTRQLDSSPSLFGHVLGLFYAIVENFLILETLLSVDRKTILSAPLESFNSYVQKNSEENPTPLKILTMFHQLKGNSDSTIVHKRVMKSKIRLRKTFGNGNELG